MNHRKQPTDANDYPDWVDEKAFVFGEATAVADRVHFSRSDRHTIVPGSIRIYHDGFAWAMTVDRERVHRYVDGTARATRDGTTIAMGNVATLTQNVPAPMQSDTDRTDTLVSVHPP